MFDVPPYNRFTFNNNGYFDYMGRSKFLEIYNEVVSVKKRFTNTIYSLQGIVGYEKSYIMAALAILLMRQGKRVIYIPHCGILAKDLRRNIKSAFLLSYADDPKTRRSITKFSSVEDVYDFCYQKARSNIDKLYVLADQCRR
ncbi:hypothetical protein FN846DRAFT_913170 [Sphaerosporella brunnea]|uniref:Uncharacterized protein n=1 Tax=Sphaerosporella brunnea TaxID=1250544 RepID=A0A5J5EEV7_9PEZI|nr:hypothetical protein FN846DRAFT_913170 [Sphaerosporella brunnea]